MVYSVQENTMQVTDGIRAALDREAAFIEQSAGDPILPENVASEVVEPLTSQEEDFCLALVENNGNYRAAYQSAFGEKVRAPTAKALMLLKDMRVVDRVRYLKGTLDQHELLTRAEHLHMMAQIRDEAMNTGALKVAAQVEIARGTVAGFYAKKDEEQKDSTLTVLVRVNGQNVAVGDHRRNVIDMEPVALEVNAE